MTGTIHKIRSLEQAKQEIDARRAQGCTVALANGVFDLLHVGHVRYLEGARAMADVLVVAVNSDRSARGCKGPHRPIVPEAERAELVAALACVDLVVIFDEPDVRRVIRLLRPDVHVKGTDYTPETIPERAEIEAYGGRVAVAGDPKQHSTTEMAQRIGWGRSPQLGVGQTEGLKSTQTGDTAPSMALHPDLKEILACPKCRGELEFHEDKHEIHCLRCRLIFDIKDDIPVMLVDEARPLDPGAGSGGGGGTGDPGAGEGP